VSEAANDGAGIYLRSYLAPLTGMLARPDVTDIYVNRPGELWVETIGFPQPVADTICKAACPPAATDTPLDLALRSACALAAAIAQRSTAEVAFASLPAGVQKLYGGLDGQPDTAFGKLYATLQETEPAL